MISFHTIALLSPVFISAVFAIQVLADNKRNKELSGKLLSLLLINILLLCMAITVYQSGNLVFFRFLDGIYLSSMLLLHPLFYLYIKAIIDNRINKIEYFVNLLPAIITFLLTSFFYANLSKDETISYLSKNMFGVSSSVITIKTLYINFIINKIIHAAQAIIYFVLVYIKINRHKISIGHFFSNTGKYKLKWLFLFNILYSIMSLIGIIINFMPTKIIQSETIYVDIAMLSTGIFAFYIGKKGLGQKSIGKSTEQFEQDIHVEGSENVSHDYLLSKINNFIVKEKAFLDPELKIWDIVKNTGINRSYISQAINSAYKMNFNHYINKFRIEQACTIMANDNNKKLEQIAYESGFNSISTFNRAFKKFKCKLPSDN